MSAHQSNIVQFGKPMTADLEDGYIRLSNTLNRAKMKLDVTFRQYKVLDAVIDRTYGFQKKSDRIAASQIAESIGYEADLTNIYADIRDLVRRKILVREGRKIGPNKQIHEWIFESKSDRTQSQKVIAGNHKTDRQQSHLQAVPTSSTPPESDSQQSQKVIVSDHHKRQKTLNTRSKDILREDAPTKIESDFELDSCPPEPALKPAKPKAARKTSAPDNFEVTDALFNWAQKTGVTVDLVSETEQFLDYHRGKGNLQSDWIATWRTWMRNSIKYGSKNKPRYGAAKTISDFQRENAEQTQRILDSGLLDGIPD